MIKLIIPITCGLMFGCGGSSTGESENKNIEDCMDTSQWEYINSSQGTDYFGWVSSSERCTPDWSLDFSAELEKNEIYEYSINSNENQEIYKISTTTKDNSSRESYMQFNFSDEINPNGYYQVISYSTISNELQAFEFSVADGNNYWTGQPLLTITYPDGQFMRCDGFDGDSMLCENGVEIKNSEAVSLLVPDDNGQYTYDYGTRLMKYLNLSF